MQKSLLDDQNTKATFSDYLKLLQLIKEAEGDKPSRVTVRWVDPPWFTEEQPTGKSDEDAEGD